MNNKSNKNCIIIDKWTCKNIISDSRYMDTVCCPSVNFDPILYLSNYNKF